MYLGKEVFSKSWDESLVSTATPQLLAICATATDYQHCSSGLSYHQEVSQQAGKGSKVEMLTGTAFCIGCGAGARAGCMLT